MPPYKFLATSSVDLEKTRFKMRGLSKVGVPYTQADIDGSVENSREQGKAIAEDLKANGVTVAADSEMVALVAYLQRLGKLRVDVAPAPKSAALGAH
jgi:cytochrome c oxidase cbb3-type subunit I/II